VFGMLALNALPPVLAGYREKGILRRLSTTPVRPSRLLAAQLAVQGVVAAVALVLILAAGRIAFSVALPGQVLGFVIAVLLGAAALLALGVFVAAVAPSARAANAAGGLLFFPMMFFAGLWIPRAQMPPLLRHISDATPLGSAARAIGDTMSGHWPHALALGVMAAWTIVFGAAAVRLFRWD
jgi:ABC-2 type transport system permease protein